MRHILVGLLAVAVACVCRAEVGSIDLQTLTKRSSLVLIGTVTSIRQDGVRLAQMSVERSVKGRAPRTIEVIAQPTWACDVSGAQPGERLLVFLDPVQPGSPIGLKAGGKVTLGRRVYAFAHAGRGRIRLEGRGKDVWISFKPESWMDRTEYRVDFILPKDLPYRKNRSGETVLPASDLLARIRRYVSV